MFNVKLHHRIKNRLIRPELSFNHKTEIGKNGDVSMNIKTRFLTSILAGSVVSAMAVYPAVTYAEEDDDDNLLEEIVVTGIRGSQMRALQTKRFSDGIMDGIAAEDMGKFPDQNISEALQRIPGVTISRAGGEGQFVTVRGMGPAFNTVLLNGRVLATENDGREFSFDILAAELMTAAEVFKTPTASLIEGGIGATINMKTARPLDKEGFHGVVSAKGLYDTSREKISPQVSGFLSQTFNDGEFGLLGSFSYTKRDFRIERVFTDGYEANRDLDFDNDGTPELTGVSIPTFISQNIDETSRERIGGTLVLQWQASDDLLLTLDGVYSKLDVNSNDRSIDVAGGPDLVIDATVNENNTVTDFTFAPGSRPTEFVLFSRPRYAETMQVGFNAEWQASDNLSTVFDTAYSKSTDSVAGKQSFFVFQFLPEPTRSLVFEQRNPTDIPHFNNLGDITDLSMLKPSWFTFEGRDVLDETFQSTFDVNYDFDDAGILISVQSGASFAYRKKEKSFAKTPGNVQCIYCYWPGHEFDGFIPTSISGFENVDGFLNGEVGAIDQDFPSVRDEAALVEYLLSDEALDTIRDPAIRDQARADILANGGLGVQPLPGEGGGVREKNYSAYVQAKFEGSFGDMPWSGNLGLRFTRTDVTSNGIGREILTITPTGGGINDAIVTFTESVAIEEKGSYNAWLPSANFKLDVHDDVVFRAAIGKTLTRATLSDLLLSKSYNVRITERNVSSGNPGLKPMMAWNYDANLTWYIDDASYLSVALFYKDLSNKSEIQTNIIQILNFDFFSTRPENTGSGSIKGVELSAQYTFSTLPAPFDGLGVQGNYTNVTQKTDGVVEDETSETYNLVTFYEKGPIQARIAYNYRAGYLESLKANRGQPKSIRAYGQWDASVSYDVTDDITVFVEAINITNSRTRSYSVFEERLIELADTGSRYTFGARMNF